MKINPLQGAVAYTGPVREKKEGHESGQEQSGKHSSGEKDQNPKNGDTPDSGSQPERIGSAIDAFHADVLTQENGLSASLEGTGPGLRVILKDGFGHIIRQLTGEEFLKLREATPSVVRTCGKILDQKL